LARRILLANDTVDDSVPQGVKRCVGWLANSLPESLDETDAEHYNDRDKQDAENNEQHRHL
jgi:hypothetical protein